MQPDESRPTLAQIGAALTEGQLRLHYLPVAPLQAGLGRAGRAFVQMRLGADRTWPDRSEWSNALRFKDTLLSGGLGRTLDRAVVELALRQISNEGVQGRRLRLFVLLSEESVVDPTFGRWIENALRQHELPASALIFTLPAPESLAAADAAIQFRLRMTKLGMSVALDSIGQRCDAVGLLTLVRPRFAFACLNSIRDAQTMHELAARCMPLGVGVIADHAERVEQIAPLSTSLIAGVAGSVLGDLSELEDADDDAFHAPPAPEQPRSSCMSALQAPRTKWFVASEPRLREVVVEKRVALQFRPAAVIRAGRSLWQATPSIVHVDGSLTPWSSVVGVAMQSELAFEVDSWSMRAAAEACTRAADLLEDGAMLVEVSPAFLASLAPSMHPGSPCIPCVNLDLLRGAGLSLRQCRNRNETLAVSGVRFELEHLKVIEHLRPDYCLVTFATLARSGGEDLVAELQKLGARVVLDGAIDNAAMGLAFTSGVEYVAGDFIGSYGATMSRQPWMDPED